MSTIIHFINVGQGNMVLIEATDGGKFVFDCNITEENEVLVFRYLGLTLGYGTHLNAFICSHRDADHMRGVRKLHKKFPIHSIWDSGYKGTTCDSSEYLDYMRLRRELPSFEIKSSHYHEFGQTRFNYLSAKDDRLPNNANAQGIVIKVEHRRLYGQSLCSAILPGDSDAQTWRSGIMEDFRGHDLKSEVLMAGHHGSLTFFDDSSYSSRYYYTEHIKAIQPDITIVSVGPNSYGHPSKEALDLYSDHSNRPSNKNKIYRTDQHGTLKLELSDNGWNLG